MMRFLIFDLANRVIAKSKLTSKERQQVLELAATIIFYNHGYKQVRGLHNLDQLWRRRLTEAYLKGANTDPLQVRHKGSVSYTDKLEGAYPGYICELFRWAQKTLGN